MSTWEHEALVGRFETSSKAEIRVEVMARDGKGYIQFTQRRRKPAGFWEAWQELPMRGV